MENKFAGRSIWAAMIMCILLMDEGKNFLNISQLIAVFNMRYLLFVEHILIEFTAENLEFCYVGKNVANANCFAGDVDFSEPLLLPTGEGGWYFEPLLNSSCSGELTEYQYRFFLSQNFVRFDLTVAVINPVEDGLYEV